jgi:hypothetical protein
LESATETVKLKLPFAVGIPEIVPELAPRTTPAGNWPDAREKVYGAVPPATVTEALYVEPTTPEGSDPEIVRLAVGFVAAVVALLPGTETPEHAVNTRTQPRTVSRTVRRNKCSALAYFGCAARGKR